MEKLDKTVLLLQETLDGLNASVNSIHKETRNVKTLTQTLQTKVLFDVLPERLILQKPLKIRKMVKPMIEKDRSTLAAILDRYKKKKQVLEQQSKIMKLKLETING